jgi:hypothetical protein
MDGPDGPAGGKSSIPEILGSAIGMGIWGTFALTL